VNTESLSRANLISLVQERDALLSKQSQRITELEARVKWFEKQLFGRKSERRLSEESRFVQLTLGSVIEEEKTPPQQETVKEYQRRVKPDAPVVGEDESALRFSESVPVKTISVPDPALAGLTEGKDYSVLREEVTHRLAQRPASYVVLKYVRQVVKLHTEEKPSTPPAPAGLFDRSIADVSLVVGLMVDKFLYHLPLYRQHQRISAAGITVSRQTLTNLVASAADLLEPIYYAQLSSILQSTVLAMDETPIKAGKAGKGKLHQGYFWPLYGDKHEVAFPYGTTRGLKEVREILGAFTGTLLSDGYQIYEKWVSESPNVIHAQCWAHTRRNFIEAEGADPPRSKKAIEYIRVLYDHEATHKELPEDDRLQRRREVLLPVVEEFFAWLSHELADLTILPSSPFSKAASYALQRKRELSVFLSDPAVPLDTNHLERALRVVPMGRKNWLFCWTEAGAHVVGKIQSLIVTCRLHGIDPYTYLVDVLQRISSISIHDVDQLTPRIWKEKFAQAPLSSDLLRE